MPVTCCCCRSRVTSLCAGPEHGAVIGGEGDVLLWGSNEFSQAGAPGMSTAFTPVPLASLGTRKVLSVACGGSHTLAIVADSFASTGGALVGWGTGTVGQLGLGKSSLLCDSPNVIALPELHGRALPVTRVYAGLVSSAAVSIAGDCFVWGDGSLGRLGLPGLPNTLNPATGLPEMVNAPDAVVWTPTHIPFTAKDVGSSGGERPTVASVGLGGSFTIYLLYPGTGPGCVMLVSGALGIDITRDKYGYPEDHAIPEALAAIEKAVDAEIKSVPRKSAPTPVSPFEMRPVILAACAGARHAGVIVSDPPGSAPRLFTAGKGWLGHSGAPATMLLPQPTMTTTFSPVSYALSSADGTYHRCTSTWPAHLHDSTTVCFHTSTWMSASARPPASAEY